MCVGVGDVCVSARVCGGGCVYVSARVCGGGCVYALACINFIEFLMDRPPRGCEMVVSKSVCISV